jgi:Uma2 family endonuclease
VYRRTQVKSGAGHLVGCVTLLKRECALNGPRRTDFRAKTLVHCQWHRTDRQGMRTMAIRRAPLSATEEAHDEVQEPSLRPFTVDEYYRMAGFGILRPDERVQLIEGQIVRMPPIGPRHAYNVERLSAMFRTRLSDRGLIRSQNPIRLARGAEPEPDVAIVRTDRVDPNVYATRHPSADDTLLVVEVADSTLAFDLGEKATMYARHGVSELWVVNLIADEIVVHREPTPAGYGSVKAATRGDTLSLLAIPDIQFTADELLG